MRGKLRGMFDSKPGSLRSPTPPPGPPIKEGPSAQSSITTNGASGSIWAGDLADAALHGPLGSFARNVAEITRAHPAGVLLAALPFAGAFLARTAYFRYGETMQFPRLFVMTVAKTPYAQHTTLLGPVYRLITAVTKMMPAVDAVEVVSGPIISTRQMICRSGAAGDNPQPIVVVGGFDGSWWRRRGSSVHTKMCNNWDGLNFPDLSDPRRLPCPPIGIVGHQCQDDLLEVAPTAFGVASRCLWCCIDGHEVGAQPKPLAEEKLNELAKGLTAGIAKARSLNEMGFAEGALALWRASYPVLTRERKDFVANVVLLGGAQVIRVAMVFALLDGSRLIEEPHLRAALTVWHYCRESAERVFGARSGDPLAQHLQSLLQAGPHTRTQMHAALHNHTSRAHLSAALASLEADGLVVRERSPTSGRPRETWKLRSAE
jgi:hypothetical protein